MQQEIFGPVFVLQSFGVETKTSNSFLTFDENDLLNKINNVDYGLSAVLYSKNIKLINNIAKNIETGSVFLNHPSTSTSEFPFGGVKRSGFGRECGSLACLLYTSPSPRDLSTSRMPSSA